MTTEQVRLKNVFNAQLHAAGWDLGGWDALLETDSIDMTPQAVATFVNDGLEMKTEYVAKDEYIGFSFHSGHGDAGVSLRFYCTEQMEAVLSIITGLQTTITRMEYMPLLQDVLEICPKMYVDSEGELILVRFKAEPQA